MVVVRVLVLNPGSTGLKASLVEDGTVTASEQVGGDQSDAEVSAVAERWWPIDAAGIRFVHGGAEHLAPVRLDDTVLAELERAADLAPLHNPTALAAARQLLDSHPRLPVVACFDTSFHVGLSAAAATYALPREWNRRWKLRRYGFHGLSHEYVARRTAELLGQSAECARIVSCHLGGGASICAMVGGQSVDTTMGFTPLEGLIMQVRSGSVDPGLLLWLLQHAGVSVDELAEALERRAGLAGLSGTSGDLRDVLIGVDRGDADCALAFEVYVHRLVREIGAMTASAGGLDILVFTGGLGEHSPRLRAAVCTRLTYLGVELVATDTAAGNTAAGNTAAGNTAAGDTAAGDTAAGNTAAGNTAAGDTASGDGDRDIASDASRVRVLVVAAREDLMVAAHTEAAELNRDNRA